MQILFYYSIQVQFACSAVVQRVRSFHRVIHLMEIKSASFCYMETSIWVKNLFTLFFIMITLNVLTSYCHEQSMLNRLCCSIDIKNHLIFFFGCYFLFDINIHCCTKVQRMKYRPSSFWVKKRGLRSIISAVDWSIFVKLKICFFGQMSENEIRTTIQLSDDFCSIF